MLGLPDYSFALLKHPLGSCTEQQIEGREADAYQQAKRILLAEKLTSAHDQQLPLQTCSPPIRIDDWLEHWEQLPIGLSVQRRRLVNAQSSLLICVSRPRLPSHIGLS